MPVKIIPEYSYPFQKKAGERAEKETLEFLKLLPEGYYVLRECKLDPTFTKKLRGSCEDRSDFVVVGPGIGVVVLEVKDWDIRTNRFEYINYYEVRKIDFAGGITILGNPYDQAEEYRNAVNGILKTPQVAKGLWVSSFVVYPRLTRTEFENVCVGAQKNNPQQKFIFDPQRTLFRDDLAKYQEKPLKLLEQYVATELKTRGRQMEVYTKQQVIATVNRLVPSEVRVGGLPDDAEAEKALVLLDAKQQQWAFSGELLGKTYLSDVAGSGKTNVLLSRAIYWAKQHIVTGGCRILVVTYSKALKLELDRILRAKIANDPDYKYYNNAIRIYDMVALMEEIVREGMGSSAFEKWRAQHLSSLAERESIEEALLEKSVDLLSQHKEQFQIYDYLLIDEIQDFSTWFMDVTMSLLKDHKNILTVGDVGQKLFERELDWGEFDIVKQRVEIQSRFLMYRSPQPVAKLAWKFLISDGFILDDLKEEGYKTDIKPRSPFTSKPVLISHSTEEELLQHIYDDIQARLYTVRPKQILCIGLKSEMLERLHHTLVAASVPVRGATKVSSAVGDYVVLADYVESKGLEREYVYILDADHLAAKSSSFASEKQMKKEVRRDRIKLFVALTRAMREVRLYYGDRHHTFIRELLQIQSTM